MREAVGGNNMGMPYIKIKSNGELGKLYPQGW